MQRTHNKTAIPQPNSGVGVQTLYVSPAGSDSNRGTISSPLATLDGARQKVRGLLANQSSNIVVLFRGGTYSLASTVSFSALDSGQNGFTVTYAAYSGEVPILSGGVPVTGWTLFDAGKNIWKATVPSGADFRQIYVNGVRGKRVSVAGSTLLSGTTLNSTTGVYTTTGQMNGYGNPTAVEFVYNQSWIQYRMPLASISSTAITLSNVAWLAHTNNFAPYNAVSGKVPDFIENAYELLSVSTTGQFYLDKSTNSLYYVPRAGEVLATASVIIPAVQNLVMLTGASNLTFQGLQFAHSTWTRPNDAWGFIPFQMDIHWDGVSGQNAQIPAAVSVFGGSNVTIDRCTLLHLGGNGVEISGGTQYGTVSGCSLSDISGIGIAISRINEDTVIKQPIPTRYCRVRSNLLHDCAYEYNSCGGIAAPYTDSLTIDHNELYNFTYTAIHIGWGWGGWGSWGLGEQGANGSVRRNNVIAWNKIHNHMTLLHDGGAIYSNSRGNGQSIKYNLIYNQVSVDGTTANGVYLDDGSDNKTVQNNVLSNNQGYYFRINDNIGNCEISHNFPDVGAAGAIGGTQPYAYASFPGVPPTLTKLNQVVSTALLPPSIAKFAGLEAQYGGYAPDLSQAPSCPATVTLGSVSGYSVPLTWTAPASVPGTLAGYEVWMNGTLLVGVAAAGTTSFTFADLTPSTSYSFTVRAFDTSGNVSVDSPPATLTTSSGLTPRSSYGNGFVA